MSSNPALHDIDPAKIVRVTSAEHDEFIRSLTFSKSDLKKSRNMMEALCTNCLKLETDLEKGQVMKKCARCKGTWYCSKKCQVNHWPTHKPNCHKVEGTGIHQHVETFIGNPYLLASLELYAVLAFDLLKKPRIDTPIMLHVELGIEPSDIRQFLAIMQSMPEESKTIEGMVQINMIQKVPEDTVLTEMRMHTWRSSRAKYPKGTQLVLVEFERSGHSFSWTCTFPITNRAFETARKAQPYEIVSAIHGRREVPMNEPNTIETMNSLIRGDRDNRFKLRPVMTRFDMEAIHSLIDSDNKSLAVEMLRVKINREGIYQPIRALLSSGPSA